jgi:ribosomal protein S12 methylthiotransferase accessory factor
LTTSLRDRAIDASRLREVAARLGVSRCSSITRLDRLGLPVWSSVRPGADERALCVHAGKAYSDREAELGALVEAIEFAVLDPAAGRLASEVQPLGALFESARRPCETLAELCPRWDAVAAPSRAIETVRGVTTAGREVDVPLQLVQHPRVADLDLFGTSTNGVGGGATLDEACLHAICELIERDTISHELVGSRATAVVADSLPSWLATRVRDWRQVGVTTHIETAPNDFAVPFFRVLLFEEPASDPRWMNAGYGCHPNAEIAIARALAEAAQSRLAMIHGVRDDLRAQSNAFTAMSEVERRRYAAALLAERAPASTLAPFHAAFVAADVAGCMQAMIARMDAAGLPPAIVVPLYSDRDLVVVRVVVPGLEFFEPRHRRVGPRLARHAERVS